MLWASCNKHSLYITQQTSKHFSLDYYQSTYPRNTSHSSLNQIIMSPSAVETVQQAVDEIKEKTLPVQAVKEVEASETHEVKPVETKAAEPEADALPKRLEGHKEPLKLSGALDHLEAFDVTPVIGREYPTADLAEILRAPNSDELLRDLAITSRFLPGYHAGSAMTQ